MDNNVHYYLLYIGSLISSLLEKNAVFKMHTLMYVNVKPLHFFHILKMYYCLRIKTIYLTP